MALNEIGEGVFPEIEIDDEELTRLLVEGKVYPFGTIERREAGSVLVAEHGICALAAELDALLPHITPDDLALPSEGTHLHAIVRDDKP